jgi:acyl-CoA synthetase (AMP-forming)/AMP-acid ligase II
MVSNLGVGEKMFYQPNDTIVSVAKQRAEKHPEQNYVSFLKDGDEQKVTLSYQELSTSAIHIATWLKQHGLCKGDRALLILPNSLEFVQTFYGCLFGGILAVPLSEPSGPKQIASYLETFIPTFKTSKPKILITTPILVDFLNNQLPKELENLFSTVKIIAAEEIIHDQPLSEELPEIQPSDIAYLQFTSGSTGTPKGIMIAHKNIMANMEQARIFGDWEEGKGTCLWLPLFHDFGLAAGLIGALYNGGFVVLMTPVQFIVKPLLWLKAISRYRCAYSYAPPFAFDMCLKKVTAEEKKNLDLSSLVSVVNGAEPVHYSGVKKFNEYFADCGLGPTAIRPGFGMAETVIMFSESKGLDTICVDKHLLETGGKVAIVDESTPDQDKKYLVNLGTHMHDHEIAIIDKDNREVPEGTVGEIMISGPCVCEGYFENLQATRDIFQQKIEGKDKPFLSTGDLGLMWKNDLYFTGRIKDIIIIRGRNYYPQDIEHAIPLVKGIRPGCVIAFDSERDSGESMVLAMEIKPNLLKDMDEFRNKLLPIIDMNVTKLVGQRFQIFPEERLYLKPGTISKTSSGKIKHGANSRKFRQDNFEGLLARISPKP